MAKHHTLLLIAFIGLAIAGIGCKPRQTLTAVPTRVSHNQFADYYPQNPMVHQVGKAIVGVAGRPLKLRGVNLGGWLLWEGWEFGKGLLLSESTIMDRLEALVGPTDADAFRDQIYANYIAEPDIQKIAQLGFNSVRIPINAKVLEDDDRPYVYKPEGWALLDRVLGWCEKYGVYAILDLHAVPGGQSRLSPSDPEPGNHLVWKSEEHKKRTVAIWQALAARYKNRRIVAGYDLINEPLPPKGQDLADLEGRIVKAIRQVDPYHMIIVEGARFSSDFSMFPQPLSGNQAYGFHMYNWFGDDRAKKLAYYRSLADQQNVPLWAGEFGENTYSLIGSTVDMYDDPANQVSGWSFWTWKKVPGRNPALVAINPSDRWEKVMEWLNSPPKNKPDRALVLAGLNDFVQAVRLENTSLDPRMLDALTHGFTKGLMP